MTFTDKRQVKIRSDSCRAYLVPTSKTRPAARPGFRVDAAAATMDEQRIPQATNAESIADRAAARG